MQYIASFFTYEDQNQRKELSQEQRDFIEKLKTTKGLFQHFPDQFIEDVLCAQVIDAQLSSLAAKKGAIQGQEKKALFMNSNVTFRVLDQETKEGEQACVPVLHFENVDYDENQGKCANHHFLIVVTRHLYFSSLIQNNQVCFFIMFQNKRRRSSYL